MLILNADGGCIPNPGRARIGVFGQRDGQNCHALSQDIGHGTSNIAEWRAAIAALTYALSQSDTDVELRMDSQLVVEQFNGRWRVKNATLKPLADIARHLGRSIEARGARLKVRWVPREQNALADALTTRAA